MSFSTHIIMNPCRSSCVNILRIFVLMCCYLENERSPATCATDITNRNLQAAKGEGYDLIYIMYFDRHL